LSVALVWAVLHAKPEARSRFWVLPVLPLVWVSIGLWGSYFWLDWEKKPVVQNPEWVAYPVSVLFCTFLVLGVALITYLRGARVFAVIYFLMNLYFVLAMSLLSGMAISGTWL
jgi:hypothetical protein